MDNFKYFPYGTDHLMWLYTLQQSLSQTPTVYIYTHTWMGMHEISMIYRRGNDPSSMMLRYGLDYIPRSDKEKNCWSLLSSSRSKQIYRNASKL